MVEAQKRIAFEAISPLISLSKQQIYKLLAVVLKPISSDVIRCIESGLACSECHQMLCTCENHNRLDRRERSWIVKVGMIVIANLCAKSSGCKGVFQVEQLPTILQSVLLHHHGDCEIVEFTLWAMFNVCVGNPSFTKKMFSPYSTQRLLTKTIKAWSGNCRVAARACKVVSLFHTGLLDVCHKQHPEPTADGWSVVEIICFRPLFVDDILEILRTSAAPQPLKDALLARFK